MAWIKIDQSLPTHRKTLSVADALDISPARVMGLLTAFWLWSLDNAPDGWLTDVSEKTIARVALWEGDAHLFVEALKTAKFLDGHDGSLVIHNWAKHTGRLMEKRAENADRMRDARASRNTDNDDERAVHVQDTCETRADLCVARVEKSRVEKSREEKKTPQLNAALFAPDSFEFQLAKTLRDKVLRRNPKAKVPAVEAGPFQAWCRQIDLMIRVDGRDPPDILTIIDWAHDDEFWHQHILSPRNLREKYDRLYLGCQRGKRGSIMAMGNSRNKPIEAGPEYETFRANNRTEPTE